MAPATSKKRVTSSSIQPSITSYFTPNTASSVAPPPLPHHLQSDLLNVGMRVRKSVTEGYKTHDSYFSKLSTNATSYGSWSNAGGTAIPTNDFTSSLPSSQESTFSNDSSTMTVAKRVHGYDSEEEEEITKTTPSPPLNLYNMSQSTLSRHFAAPKSQKLRNMRSSHYAAVSRKPFDAFSLMKESEPVEDFEEAGFLRPVGDVMDVE